MTAINHKSFKIIILIALVSLSSCIAYALLQSSHRINSTGQIKTIGVVVYSSPEGGLVTSIEWGYLEPGEIVNKTVYIKNEGTIAVRLTHLTENWNPPSAESFISFSWDKENQILSAGEVTEATLTLSIDENISGIDSFSFDIVIIATEA